MTTVNVINLKELSGEELIDAKVVATLLGLSIRTVRDMASRRELPLYKIRSSVRFKVDEIRAWRDERKVS